jgi:hypothetical protein
MMTADCYASNFDYACAGVTTPTLAGLVVVQYATPVWASDTSGAFSAVNVFIFAAAAVAIATVLAI